MTSIKRGAAAASVATVGPIYAFDPSERPRVGLGSREWTAVGATELEIVAEMARCLREIKAGRVPT